MFSVTVFNPVASTFYVTKQLDSYILFNYLIAWQHNMLMLHDQTRIMHMMSFHSDCTNSVIQDLSIHLGRSSHP